MSSDWQVEEGSGWIQISDFGRLAPRRDDIDGGRQYFTAKLPDDSYATVRGDSLSGGPETWHFEFDQPFWLADRYGRCLEVMISLLEGGRYAVKYRPGDLPVTSGGGW